MAVTLTATEPHGLCNITWGPSLVRYLTPQLCQRDTLPFTPQNCSSHAFPGYCPPLHSTLAPSPQGDTKIIFWLHQNMAQTWDQ